MQLNVRFRADTLESGQRRLLAAVEKSLHERSPQPPVRIELIDRILTDKNAHGSRGTESDRYQFIQSRNAKLTAIRH